MKTEFVVITGGPGAGKTATLEYLRKITCEHVAILPEAAGIIFSGGFWRLHSKTAVKAGQKAIYHVQQEMQNLVVGERRWSTCLCDRGLLDGLAYWPGKPYEFFKALNTTKEVEYAKYKAVIHLRSPSEDHGYNHSNPIRIENAELAKKIDARIHAVWRAHPNYILVDSTESFIEKVDKAARLIESFINRCPCKTP